MPSPGERRLLERLLSVDFHGVAELLAQLRVVRVRTIPDYAESHASLEFLVPDDAPVAPTRVRIPTEASYRDSDGVDVHLLLHVVDGRMSELEVYKDDGTEIAEGPAVARLSVEPATEV
jgi:hypothetical protein